MKEEKSTNSIVCTLFEGHYHYGVAALINSLYKHGFRGNIYAGYRGVLPKWTHSAEDDLEVDGNFKCKKLILFSDLIINFIYIDSDIHLTNYKPTFVIDLLNKIEKKIDNVFYFDPDIVVRCRWSFFERWVLAGVVLVHEVINNDMPINHPVRDMWREIIVESGFEVNSEYCGNSYINAGFFGLKRRDMEFLYLYENFVRVSINKYNLNLTKFAFVEDRTHPFFAKDQDALNIAIMCKGIKTSEFGPEGMDFINGGKLMSHAVGIPKPWKKYFLIEFLKGKPPSLADKQYWLHVNEPIFTANQFTKRYKLISIKISSFLGRFYRKY